MQNVNIEFFGFQICKYGSGSRWKCKKSGKIFTLTTCTIKNDMSQRYLTLKEPGSKDIAGCLLAGCIKVTKRNLKHLLTPLTSYQYSIKNFYIAAKYHNIAHSIKTLLFFLIIGEIQVNGGHNVHISKPDNRDNIRFYTDVGFYPNFGNNEVTDPKQCLFIRQQTDPGCMIHLNYEKVFTIGHDSSNLFTACEEWVCIVSIAISRISGKLEINSLFEPCQEREQEGSSCVIL